MGSLTDTQNERDERAIAIDRVGVKELRFPISVKDRDGSPQRTVATVALAVDLPHHYKGTHMSRFVEVLNSHGDCLSVRDMARLPKELLGRLDAQRAHVAFRFPFFKAKPAPVTEKVGLMDYGVVFDIDSEKDGPSVFTVTVEVPVATLCPCSKAISSYGAHNQRGTVTFAVRFSETKEPMWIEELIAIVEKSASCELYSLLKRPDEKAVTERAYDNPVFVEDLVRNVALAAKAESRVAWFRVEAENYESIHNHNAYAVIEQQLR